MLSDAAAREYLERMVPLQEAFTENVKGLNEIKQEGRSDGFSLEAVNALLPILVMHPYDKGAAVLNEVIRYAEAFGAEGLVAKGDADAQASAGGPAGAEVAQPPAAAPAAAEVRPRGRGSGRLRIWTQVAVSLSLTFGLIWLLN